MATYRCNDCGQPIFTGNNLRGSLQLPCPNRQCRSRQRKPTKQQTFNFDAATAALGVGQKAMRGSARRGQ